MRRLIVTADDFGASIEVNRAVEIAHREGVLSTASLMMGGEAAADAVERAYRLPGLRVGLHVTLVDGRPVLPPERIPDLVGTDGRFSADLFRAGVKFFFLPRVRRQLRAEIRAQFEAFRATGLPLDHANAHHHMHLHPTVLAMMLEIGREYGLAAVRLPREPWRVARRSGGRGAALAAAALAPWVELTRLRLARAGVRCNDYVLGLADSGAMHKLTVLRLLRELPEGVTEVYFHPAEPQGGDGELAALLSPSVRAALVDLGLRPMGFADV